MIEVAFRQLLIADADVAPLVTDRVWFNTRPQDVRDPGIVLSLVSNTPAQTLTGFAGYSNGRMQLNCLAPTYPQAKQLAAVVRDALDGYSGVQDSTTIARLTISGMRDLPVLPLVGSGQPATFAVSIDCLFLIKE